MSTKIFGFVALLASVPAFAEGINETQADGTTALHWAVRSDDLKSVDQLIRGGAKVQTADRYGVTPLQIAAGNANVAIIRRLLDAGADPSTADPRGETVLMIAARTEGGADAVKALIERGANVNATDRELNQTPVMWATRANHPEIVSLLLKNGAKVDARTRVGETPERKPPNAGGGSHGVGIIRSGWPERGAQDPTPGGMSALLYAARDGDLEIVRILLDAGAKIDQTDPNAITPLLTAITNNHLDVAQLLLSRGADVKTSDYWGRTALWAAIEIRNLEFDRSGEQGVDRDAALELFKTILNRPDVDVNARTKEVPPVRRWRMSLGDLSWVDSTGQTPFWKAALSADLTVMRLLLAKGADPKIPTNGGTTPIMAAAGVNWAFGQTFTESKSDSLEAVKLCYELGGDVNTANTMGITAVIGAANRGSDDVLQFLVDKGAKLDVKDKEGRTPVDWAEGVFIALNPPDRKESTVALLHKLMGSGKSE